MKTFEDKWQFVSRRRQNMVQDRAELEYVHGLMEACKPESYLEIGTAEGDSLYVLGSILPEHERIHWIDKDEFGCRKKRIEIEDMLKPRVITGYSGLSTDDGAVIDEKFDVVMIDGGHDYETVRSDCKNYACQAKKYVFWHDIQIPEVKKAIYDFIEINPHLGNISTFINSDTMGYAILEIK
jgi:hypothetical protein